MLGWSINLFRVAGIRLALHWSLVLLFAYVVWEGQRVAGVRGAAWMAVFFALLFSCVVLHELGHCLAARRYGVHVARILLLPIGGMAEFDRVPRLPKQELVVALCGPLVNFGLLVALLIVGVTFPADWDGTLLPLGWAEMGRHLLVINLVMGCFNLIPVFPMDGGRVFRALLALRFPYVPATFYAATLGKLLAAIGALVMILWLDHWLGAVLFGFIFFAGEAEYRFLKRKAEEEARWQALLQRFAPAPAMAAPRAPPNGGGA